MSFEKLKWALDQEVDTPLQKLVLVVLADCHNDKTDQCFPSISYLKDRASCSRQGVVNALKKLEQIGLVSSQKQAGKSTFYTLSTSQLSRPHQSTECTSTSQLSSETSLLSVHTSQLSRHEPINNQEVTLRERAIPSKFCPPDFQPNQALIRMTRIPPGIDVNLELEKFKNWEFKHPKSDWDRAFQFWLTNAEKKPDDGLNDLERKTNQLLGV